MPKLQIGYDDNLGLPNDFPSQIGCEIVPYHDLAELIQAFTQKKLSAVFIPAGTLPYIHYDKIISQALLQNSDHLQSDFVTTKDITLENIMNYTLGRVNKYCTTSYWAPRIYLMQFLSPNTVLKFKDTNGFQDMLDKTAQGVIDGAMVWNLFIEHDKAAAEKVHQLFSLANLPTPIMVAEAGFPEEIKNKINQFKTKDTTAFFQVFQAPNLKAIQSFQKAMQDAIEFYAKE